MQEVVTVNLKKEKLMAKVSGIKPITNLNPVPSKLKDCILSLTGLKSCKVEYTPKDNRLYVEANGIVIDTEFPDVIENFSVLGHESLGHMLSFPGGTSRFCRPILRHRRVSPWFNYHDELPLHQIGGDISKYIESLIAEKPEEFYISGYWFTIAEILSKHLLNKTPQIFKDDLTYLHQRIELVKNEWGLPIMGQELIIGIPEPDQCIEGFKSEGLGAIAYYFQERALVAGYALSATSKSEPGSVVTWRIVDKPGCRTLVSRMILPVSFRRACRLERELRSLREASKFSEPNRPMTYLPGLRLPDVLTQYLTCIPVLFADFKHTVPSVRNDDGTMPETWSPTASMNKDRFCITSLGQKMLRCESRVHKILSEEQYARQQEYIEKKPDYVLEGIESVYSEGSYVKVYYVSWSDQEKSARHVKLLFAGVKGMTEPITTKLFVSHRSDLTIHITGEEEDEEELIQYYEYMKMCWPVACVISASAILSKAADSLMTSAVLERLARHYDRELEVADESGRKWVSLDRATESAKGNVTNRKPDTIDWLEDTLEKEGQSRDGTMYVWRQDLNKKGLLVPVLTQEKIWDKTRGRWIETGKMVHLKAVFGWAPGWRTRHNDNVVGGDIKAFGAVPIHRQRYQGIQTDIHTSGLSNIPWYLSDTSRKRINTMADTILRLSQHLPNTGNFGTESPEEYDASNYDGWDE